MHPSDMDYMRMAIAAANAGVAEGESPFGACIVRQGEVLACVSNRVWKDADSTAHAEVVAIREACRKTKSIDLSGATIYSTCEPCPMCFGACHWAKLAKIYFGASIADAMDLGFSELTFSNQKMKDEGGSPLEIHPGLLREECLEIFRRWSAHPRARLY